MTYTITLADGSKRRVTATAVMLHPTGAIMFGDNPQTFTIMFAHGIWVECELSAIQNAN